MDARDCQKLPSYASDKLVKGFSNEMIEEASSILKMTKVSAYICVAQAYNRSNYDLVFAVASSSLL